MNVKSLLTVLMVFALPWSVGCGNSAGTYPVTGRVALSGDLPLVDATVTFKPTDGGSQARPRGQTDENGQFELRLDEKSNGALPGTYQVTINEALGDDLDARPQPKIHARYSSFEKSGLQFTVEQGGNHFDIQVEPPVARKR